MGVTLARPPADASESEPVDKPRESSVAAMLKGHRVCLRPVREADLDSAYDAHTNLGSRGEFFPQGVLSESAFRREFAEHGFWQKSEGMLLIKTDDDELAGHIEFFLGQSPTGMPSSSPISSTTIAMHTGATPPRPSSSWSTTCSGRRRNIASSW